jgi:hypothetical protein
MSIPKRILAPVSNGDFGGGKENIHVRLEHGLLDPAQILELSVHSSHDQRRRRATANLSKHMTPSPPSFLGQQTVFQLTLHFALVVVSFADKSKALLILLMNLKVPGGTTSGVR